MLAIYAMPIAMLNTAVAPLLLDVTPREYLGRVMAVFTRSTSSRPCSPWSPPAG